MEYSQSESLKIGIANTKYVSIVISQSGLLKNLDISENTHLQYLIAQQNPLLASLETSALPNLISINVTGCGLTTLDISNNCELQEFKCGQNALTELNGDNATKLKTLHCPGNKIATLRISNNTLLEDLNASGNQLLNVNTRSNVALKSLNLSGNSGITALALDKNLALENLDASGTALTDIDLSANTALKDLNLSGCSSMSIIDLAANTALTTLNLSGTSLTTLDVSKNTSLKDLDITNTPFKSSVPIGYNLMIGVVFSNSGSTVKIVSTDEASKTWDYYGTTTSATSTSDGVANTNKIPNSSAAKWCRKKGSAWYLPAKDELSAIYNNKANLNTTLSSIGGTQLTGYYWSSTEDGKNYAYGISLSNGNFYSSSKDRSYNVRAVRVL